MGFSQKSKDYFREKGMTNRDISRAMDNYSESMISKSLGSEKFSKTWMEMVQKYFPDAPIGEWLTPDEMPKVEESASEYKKRGEELISRIRTDLDELEMIMSRG